jgi:hypothetical protein
MLVISVWSASPETNELMSPNSLWTVAVDVGALAVFVCGEGAEGADGTEASADGGVTVVPEATYAGGGAGATGSSTGNGEEGPGVGVGLGYEDHR